MNNKTLIILLAIFATVMVLDMVSAVVVCPDAHSSEDCQACCFAKHYNVANYSKMKDECWCGST